MHIVSGMAARSTLNNLYEELCWPTLGQRRLQSSIKIMYNICNGSTPSYYVTYKLYEKEWTTTYVLLTILKYHLPDVNVTKDHFSTNCSGLVVAAS